MRTRERLEHPEGQGPLSETKLSLEANSWTREGKGNVQTVLLQLLLQGSGRYVLRKRRRHNPVLVSMGIHVRKWRLSPAHVVGTSLDETAGKHDMHVGENGITHLCVVAPTYLRSPRHDPLHILALY